jgi:hypothetical protein
LRSLWQGRMELLGATKVKLLHQSLVALRPNHGFSRTRRYGLSTWRTSARRAGYLDR